MTTFLKSINDLPLGANPTKENEERRINFIERAKAVASKIHHVCPQAIVIGFGSTFTGFLFNKESDIDIAVEGIPIVMRNRIWRIAVDAAGIEDVDIVIIEEADQRLLASIRRDGVYL